MDRIEDTNLDGDEGGPMITLQGDFVDTLEKYLDDEEQLDITFYIGPELMDDLVKQWDAMRHG